MGCHFLLQGNLPHPGIKAWSLALQEDFLSYEPLVKLKLSEEKSLSHVQLFVTPWTVAYQAPLSLGFSGQEYWSGVPFPSLLVR